MLLVLTMLVLSLREHRRCWLLEVVAPMLGRVCCWTVCAAGPWSARWLAAVGCVCGCRSPLLVPWVFVAAGPRAGSRAGGVVA
ncbi:hypothetical protein PF001_g813, partial [Phytophthora fragariae]